MHESGGRRHQKEEEVIKDSDIGNLIMMTQETTPRGGPERRALHAQFKDAHKRGQARTWRRSKINGLEGRTISKGERPSTEGKIDIAWKDLRAQLKDIHKQMDELGRQRTRGSTPDNLPEVRGMKPRMQEQVSTCWGRVRRKCRPPVRMQEWEQADRKS